MYLGFIMTSHNDENDTISKETRALYARGNMLLSKFRHCSHDSSSLCPYRRICRNPISSYKALSQLNSCHPIMWHPITLS